MFDSTIANMIKNQQSQNAIRDYMRTKSDKGNMDIVQNCLWHIKEGHLTRRDIDEDILSKENMSIFLSSLKSEHQPLSNWKKV
jgi:hypothetical protein